MKYVIDTEILKNNNLTLAEFGVLLYYLDKNQDKTFNEISEELWNKNYLIKEINNYVIEPHHVENLQVLLAESYNSKSVNERAVNLAEKLRDLYPSGKIYNTNYYYKGNKSDIINKLKTFFAKYGNQYTDEQIINATKKYVESFNGNYAYLKLLKYFIWKDERAKGESVQSLLADFIENEDAENTMSNDWTSTLK